MAASTDVLLEASELSVCFGPARRPVRAVSNVDFSIRRGEIVGIAGESGSGKSTLCLALIRSLAKAATVTGEVLFEGRSLYALTGEEMRQLRRKSLGMVMQNPMTSLDPMFTIGNQLGEMITTRAGRETVRLDRKVIDLLHRVNLSVPELRAKQFPHQLSGGMKQRVLTAMATSSDVSLLVADEPTSALDATIQEEILALFSKIRDRTGTAIMIVSHDLMALSRICDRIVVMYAGRVAESGPTEAVFTSPRHPYTYGLITSVPTLDNDDVELGSIAGQVPSLAELPPGCAFAERCFNHLPCCAVERPPMKSFGMAHTAICWNCLGRDGVER
jgi:oligopeptide/dipeptide ABC transporter ATP-binding protein